MEIPPESTAMTEVVCADCGVRFQITHQVWASDLRLAERQAAWLADQFVWDHIQEHKHRASIELPQLPPGAHKGQS